MEYRLVCFDLDGTLVEPCGEVQYWGSLHREIEGKEEGARINRERVARFAAGKLGYAQWVDLDLSGFRDCGATKADFERVARMHRIAKGAREAVLELHRRGLKLAVVSVAITILIETLFPDHPFDDVYANEISFDARGRIESWRATPYGDGAKHLALQLICKREGISLTETVFVGDGENDIEALREAGLGIAFCPKSGKVRAAADVVIEKNDMREILKYLG